jgi:hypothetical protein
MPGIVQADHRLIAPVRALIGERSSSRTAFQVREVAPSTIAVVALAGAIALLLSLPFFTQLQADSYKALYDGRWILQHGLPHREALTIMARGRAWIDEQWLAEVLLYGAWRTGGYALVAIVAAVAVSSAYMILAALMSRRGASVWLVLFSVTVAILSLTGWQFIRSQDFALPLFAALLAICVTDSESERPGARLVLLLPVLILWANLHGSVLLGAAMATAYLLFRALIAALRGQRRTAFACASLAAATAVTPLATPYGTEIIHYYREFAGNAPMARLAIEWAPPRFPSFAFFELCVPAAFALAAMLLASIRGWRPSAVVVGAAAMTAAAGAVESGSIVWFGMAASLLLADAAKTWFPTRPRAGGFALALAIPAVLLGGFVLAQLSARSGPSYESLLPSRVMALTTAYAGSHPCTLVLADNLSSSALLWHDPWLAGRIGFDARLEQYPRAALTRFVAFTHGPSRGWAATHAGYGLLVGDSFYARGLVRKLERFPSASVLARQRNGVAVVSPSQVEMALAGCGAATRRGRA